MDSARPAKKQAKVGTCHKCAASLTPRQKHRPAKTCPSCGTHYHTGDCGYRYAACNLGQNGELEECPKCAQYCLCSGGPILCHAGYVRAKRRKTKKQNSGAPLGAQPSNKLAYVASVMHSMLQKIVELQTENQVLRKRSDPGPRSAEGGKAKESEDVDQKPNFAVPTSGLRYPSPAPDDLASASTSQCFNVSASQISVEPPVQLVPLLEPLPSCSTASTLLPSTSAAPAAFVTAAAPPTSLPLPLVTSGPPETSLPLRQVSSGPPATSLPLPLPQVSSGPSPLDYACVPGDPAVSMPPLFSSARPSAEMPVVFRAEQRQPSTSSDPVGMSLAQPGNWYAPARDRALLPHLQMLLKHGSADTQVLLNFLADAGIESSDLEVAGSFPGPPGPPPQLGPLGDGPKTVPLNPAKRKAGYTDDNLLEWTACLEELQQAALAASDEDFTSFARAVVESKSVHVVPGVYDVTTKYSDATAIRLSTRVLRLALWRFIMKTLETLFRVGLVYVHWPGCPPWLLLSSLLTLLLDGAIFLAGLKGMQEDSAPACGHYDWLQIYRFTAAFVCCLECANLVIAIASVHDLAQDNQTDTTGYIAKVADHSQEFLVWCFVIVFGVIDTVSLGMGLVSLWCVHQLLNNKAVTTYGNFSNFPLLREMHEEAKRTKELVRATQHPLEDVEV